MITIEKDNKPRTCQSCFGTHDLKLVRAGTQHYKVTICLCKACRSLLLRRLAQDAGIKL